MVDELWQTFHVDEVDEAELAHVISRQMPAARQVAPDEVEYLRSHDEPDFSLKLVYKGPELVTVEGGPALRPQDIEAIRRAIEDELLGPGGSIVAASVLFSAVPVNGWWRYRDDFQVLPVPEGSPRPDALLGAHPFVLEVRVPDSPDALTRIHRRDRRVRVLDLVLGSFLRLRVRGPDSWYRQFWVYLPHEEPKDGHLRSAHLQEGYSLTPGGGRAL